MWRSGRMPSSGSARQSRSESSDGCGPLKPAAVGDQAFADARDHRRDFMRQPAMAGGIFRALAIQIEMEFHRPRAPAMHRAFDHRGPAGVIRPAGGNAGGVANCGDGGKIGFGCGRGIGGNAMEQGDVFRARRAEACAAAATISSMVAMPVDRTTGFPVAAQALSRSPTRSS